MIIIGSHSIAIFKVKLHVFRELRMKDLGFLRYFLGIEVIAPLLSLLPVNVGNLSLV